MIQDDRYLHGPLWSSSSPVIERTQWVGCRMAAFMLRRSVNDVSTGKQQGVSERWRNLPDAFSMSVKQRHEPVYLTGPGGVA